jgi:undecaprenyl diphosphate synthase
MHIGIIMDGNGRWATAQGLPRLSGHAAGVQAVKRLIRACPDLKVDTVTLFAFAIANWKRDKEEVDGLWVLFQAFLKNDMEELLHEGVRVRVIGDRDGLPHEVKDAAEKIEKASLDNNRFLLQIALNYDGVDEVARMVRRAVEGGVEKEEIDSLYIKNHLDTEKENEPDIVLRTGMPKAHDGMSVWRSSAFLPIQSSQSVCVSVETLWPDFTPEDLSRVIAYADPDARLFGGQRVEGATSARAL